MSTVSSREKNMLLITVVIVLYAAAALTFKKQVANWKVAERVYQAAKKKYHEEEQLIAARAEWDARYEKMRSLMPVFPFGKDVGTHWMTVMEHAAVRNGVVITRQQQNSEAEVGDVYELPIDCKDWEAPLENLVKFLYDLEQQGATLDVRQLAVRQGKPGYLKGSFVLYCAYMRDDSAAVRPEAAAEKPEGQQPPAEAAPATNGVPAAAVEAAAAPTTNDAPVAAPAPAEPDKVEAPAGS